MSADFAERIGRPLENCHGPHEDQRDGFPQRHPYQRIAALDDLTDGFTAMRGTVFAATWGDSVGPFSMACAGCTLGGRR